MNNTFNNLKNELKDFDMEQLKSKLEEQQKELFSKNTILFTGNKRIIYNPENKFNIKKLHKIIAIIKNSIRQKQNDRSPGN